MKKIFLLVLISLTIIGCRKEKSVEPELTPQEISQMSEEEREAEINKILQKVGAQLPENWKDMTKQERGLFILKYGLGIDVEKKEEATSK